MTLTAGALSQNWVSSNTDQLLSAVATSGTAPYTYQWYRSTTTGFSPGAGNLISGATALTLNDSGLIPNTTYYYKVVVTDSASATATSSQLTVVTAAASGQSNAFAQSPVVGQVDMAYNTNTVAAQIDVSQSGNAYCGQAVKLVTSGDTGGVPKVVACSADSDAVYGFINYTMKDSAYAAGDMVEVSRAGNVIFLYANAAITRGSQVTLDVTSPGVVGPYVQSSGARIVGEAFGEAAGYGAPLRVLLSTSAASPVA